MKKKFRFTEFLAIIFLLGVLVFVYYNRTTISKYIVRNFFIENIYMEPNIYYKGVNYLGFQQTDDYIPGNKTELKNMFYTILDKGYDNFTFYFEDYYTTYLEDIEEMTNDGTFATINNYVHPYNSYRSINFSINDFGIANVSIEKVYSDENIAIINAKLDSIIANNINPNSSNLEKIIEFHDYIVNNTVYDIEEAKLVDQDEIKNSLSYNAYNVVINGIGLCGGYSDTLAIYLSRLGINNFKVSTDKHVWNAILVNNTWKHIDMTWDDPVTSNNSQILIHDYFMIDTRTLKNLDQEKHNFNPNLYLEVR